jgi:hypothetical protein
MIINFAADSRRYIDFLQVLSPAHRLRRAWGYLASHWQPDRVLPRQHHYMVWYRGEPIQQRVRALDFHVREKITLTNSLVCQPLVKFPFQWAG